MSNDLEKLLLELDEAQFSMELQKDFVNFYEPSTVNPYIPLAAKGPWIVTTHGAVIHDNGGYGMLGMGHDPTEVMESMSGSCRRRHDPIIDPQAICRLIEARSWTHKRRLPILIGSSA